ncbi:LacI family transcriptional regulator [Leifsonia sp. EB41]|uniref:LacI family DNA-binding transcriptional regulator n=1 Tax=Leifsonia sp. EB41 TaxID=3156260 RepID=UPI00351821C7
MDGKPTTIREIAAIAGVSAGTVSRVMNGKPGVGKEARKRISELIAEYDFRGDGNARQLAKGRSDTIGIVFPLHASEVVMHPVYPDLLGAISDSAQLHGKDVNLFTTASGDPSEHIIDAFRRRRVDGLILPAASSEDPLIARVVEEGIPTVLIGHRQASDRMTWVDCTHDEAIEEIARRLIAAGRRRIVLLNGPRRVCAYGLRSEGFWRAIEASGLSDLVGEEVELDMGYAAGIGASAAVRDADAVICSADSTAGGILELLRDSGREVPATVDVTGFDDTPFSAHANPPLTTVRMPLRETGELAVQHLIRLTEESITPAPTILPTTVVWRGSTGERAGTRES